MRRVEKRLNALETLTTPTIVWIPPPGEDLAGWEVLVGNGEAVHVDRQQHESDSELRARAAQAMREALRAMGGGYGHAVMFGYDQGGMTR